MDPMGTFEVSRFFSRSAFAWCRGPQQQKNTVQLLCVWGDEVNTC